jgi:glycosyltransferase involved in cell wall biosynthesis
MTFSASAPPVSPDAVVHCPAYNEECELLASLRAIRAAADAAGHSYEIVVANDSSDDRTPEIAREFGANVVDVRLRQIAAVRNAGARIAKGDIFFFVDADTHIEPVHITRRSRR